MYDATKFAIEQIKYNLGTIEKDVIKISILRDGEGYAYMEYQGGNDPKIFNNTYGSGGFYTLEEACESIVKTYAGFKIQIEINL